MNSPNRLTAVILEVHDLEQSLALYRDGFGLALSLNDNGGDDRWISGAHSELSWREGAYLHFALYQAESGEGTTGAQAGFMAGEIEVADRAAMAAGATLIHAPRPEPWGTTARYRDFDGNVVSLTQQRPKS